VSLNSSDPDEYKGICGGNLSQVMKNIEMFSARSEIPIVINVVAVRESLGSYLDLISFARGVWASRLDFQNLALGGVSVRAPKKGEEARAALRGHLGTGEPCRAALPLDGLLPPVFGRGKRF